MLRGTYLWTTNSNAGGVNRGRPRPKAFSFSSPLSSSHARAPRPRAFLHYLSEFCCVWLHFVSLLFWKLCECCDSSPVQEIGLL